MKHLKNIRIQAILVFFVAVLQYANTANHDYAWDDAIVLTQNTRVQKGLSDIPELFKNIKSNETQNRYGYRPIALLSFATDVELFGMDPKAAHRVNILLYGILCVIILLFIKRLFPENVIGGLLVTLLFVVHPIHTEVVANIKSRDEILALGFGLLSLMFYAKAISGGKWFHYILSLLLMVLGFLSKESAITLIGVAFLLPWVLFDAKDHLGNLKKSLPLIGFFLLLIAIRMLVYSDMMFESNDFELQEKGLFLEDGYVGNPLFAASWSERVATAFFLISYFLYRFIMPYPLLHDYSFDQFAVQSFSSPLVWLSIGMLILLIVVGVYGLLKKEPFGIGVILFLLSSTIYLHLVQIAPDIFAERFLFVPSLGICIALLSLFNHSKTRKLMTVATCVVLLPMFAYSVDRNKVWVDNQTLLETDLPRLENCVRANYNYALFLHQEYYKLPREKQPKAKEEVLKYYERTMELTDRLFNVYVDLGAAYMEFGKPEKGYEIFVHTTEKYPDLSIPWVQLGKYYMSFNKFAEAIPYFKRAMRNGSKNSDYNYLLAICMFNSNWYDEAVETMLEGEQLGVSSSAYHSLLAKLYIKLGQKKEALEALDRGLALYPNDQGLMADHHQLMNELNSAQ